MILALFLFDQSMSHVVLEEICFVGPFLINHQVTITFTALIFTELLNVCFEIHNWHYLMVLSQVHMSFLSLIRFCVTKHGLLLTLPRLQL